MLSCRDASRLASQALDQPLNFSERIGLRLHLLICLGCKAFARQLQQIRKTCRRVEHSEEINAETGALTAAAKARILQGITAKRHGKD